MSRALFFYTLSGWQSDATMSCQCKPVAQHDRLCCIQIEEGISMAKKGNRLVIKIKSTESGHTYTTQKNRKNDPGRLELRRYDPIVRRHVIYRETK
jgi:large subunit ribosomal protein L33